MTNTPGPESDDTDALADQLGEDGPADTAQGLEVEAERDRVDAGPGAAETEADADSDRVDAGPGGQAEVARQEAEQGGG